MLYCFIAAVLLKTKFLVSGYHLLGVEAPPPPSFISPEKCQDEFIFKISTGYVKLCLIKESSLPLKTNVYVCK